MTPGESADACLRDLCGGRIMTTGFCDRCGLAPRPSVPGSGPRTVRRPPRTSRRRVASELYELPEIEPPDPVASLDPDPHVSVDGRVCWGCSSRVGQATLKHPEGFEEGFCDQCGKPFSFVVKLHPGDMVDGRYQVRGVIGRGGYGWVYLADDVRLGAPVALKGLVNTEDDAARRIATNEVRRLTQLDHPHLVRVITVAEAPGPDGGQLLVLDYVPGVTLRSVLHSAPDETAGGVALPLEQVVRYGMDLLVALDYLHERGLLYCDLKPDNVIHSGTAIKLVDMGALRDVDDRDSPHVGTFGYQVSDAELDEHGATVRSDLYSLGRVLDELHPMEGETADRPLEEASFHAIVARATDSFERRFVDAGEMHRQLDGVLRDLLAVRTGVECPVASRLFDPQPRVLDGGLAAVPSLDELRDMRTAGPPAVGVTPGDSLAAAAVLPTPTVAEDDGAAEFLSLLRAPDARRLLAKLESGPTTAETLFARIRTHVELREPERAERVLRDVKAFDPPVERWRLRWHDAVVAMARNDPGAAEHLFHDVVAHWPGEPAPKLAVALCRECQGRPDGALAWYGLIDARDRGMADAAFGLARLHLAAGRRKEAVDALERVPATSRHYDSCRLAVVRARLAPAADGTWPSVSDVADAVGALPGLYLDQDSRERLETVVWSIAHHAILDRDDDGYWRVARPLLEALTAAGAGTGPPAHRLLERLTGGAAAEQRPAEILRRPVPDAPALALARAFHRLARRATHAADRSALLDRAHGVRPSTWL